MRRVIVLVSMLTLLFPATALAEDPSAADRFELAPVQGAVDVDLRPLSLDDTRTETVMLEMRGDPVAVEQGRAPNKEISEARKEQIKRELRGRQDALTGRIAAAGGEVLAQYQVAYNGIKVRVARNKISELAQLPNVVAVRAIEEHEPNNADSVPFIGAPGVWEDLGLTGTDIKIAIIDTGLDYTHANFGGPGTEEAFEAADETDTEDADPAFFGPEAPKVKGGFDFVGDDYNASDPDNDTPAPDPNPLDCNGHGSHVGGTAAGFGVLSDGSTYPGPYDGDTHNNDFLVGPGVAPEADLYGLRVFGCTGSTNVTVDAIEWAVDEGMDVINMSLGATFGRPDDPSAVASDNAALAGIVVVVSAGNSGAQQYITGSPSVGTRTISVAAQDTIPEFPGAVMTLTDDEGAPLGSINAINANESDFADGTTFEIVVLRDDAGNVALGCSPDDYDPEVVAGKLVVVQRGVCARVARAVYGEQAGAAAVAMINSDAGFPPLEGPILSNPDTGEKFRVTIPFLGVRGVLGPAATPDGDTLVAADGGSVSLANTVLENANYTRFAGFSSSGPRRLDSWLKPDITAPGVSILSTAVSYGSLGLRNSGTSMAAPHVAGVAALTIQAHPDWTSVEDLKAAIVNTGDPSRIGTGGGTGFRISRGGTGLVQPQLSTQTQVVALGNEGTSSLSFGFEELGADFSGTLPVTVRNHGDADATFTVGTDGAAGAPHSALPSSATVIVPAGGEASVDLTLNVPAATVGSAGAFRDVAGFVTLTPQGDANGGIGLRVPYYLVARASANVETTLSDQLTAGKPVIAATVSNTGGTRNGDADFYQWGLTDGNDGLEQNDLRAVGTQSFDHPALGKTVVFAVNTWGRWDNNAVDEYDILIDIDEDGDFEHAVVGVDIGLVLAGAFNGQMGAFAINLETGAVSVFFVASYRFTNGTTLLPVPASAIGLSAANPDFEYIAAAFALRDGTGDDFMSGSAEFDAWNPAITGDFRAVVAPNTTVPTTVRINTVAFAQQKPLGLMIVSADNLAGADEAQLVRALGSRGRGRP